MSLRWRIWASSVFVVILTAALIIGVAYWNTQRSLAQLTTSIGQEEADFISQLLSQEYSEVESWETLENALVSAGYIFDEDSLNEVYELYPEDLDFLGEDDPTRVLVLNMENKLLIDSKYLLEPGTVQLNLSGEAQQIIDLRTGEQVGTVIVQFNSTFLRDQSSTVLSDTLQTVSVGGIITIIVVSLLAAWFTQRLTAPILALIQAMRTIAERGNAQLLPVQSADELGQMSMAFNTMTIGLQTQRDLRKRLIDDVSHELNTPLSVIQLEAKGLQDQMQTPEEAADQIIQEVGMLRNLVHDLNWLAETDSGELRLNLEPYALDELLTTEVERWQTQSQAKQIELTLNTVGGLPNIQLDTMRISQVLGNILKNALQYSEAGGEIEVSTALTTLNTTDAAGPDAVAITIADQGIGINPAELPHIFDRFYRADQSRSRITGGRGLGLSITKAIIEAHRGTITIDSDGVGQGTTVQIKLPI